MEVVDMGYIAKYKSSAPLRIVYYSDTCQSDVYKRKEKNKLIIHTATLV